GRAFGLAFQITDDLLDVEGQTDQAGKRVGKDAARGKLTYPGLLGAAESRRRAEDLWRMAGNVLRPLGTAARPLAALAGVVLDPLTAGYPAPRPPVMMRVSDCG